MRSWYWVAWPVPLLDADLPDVEARARLGLRARAIVARVIHFIFMTDLRFLYIGRTRAEVGFMNYSEGCIRGDIGFIV